MGKIQKCGAEKGGHSHTQTMIGCVGVQQEGENESEKCGFLRNYKPELGYTPQTPFWYLLVYMYE